MRKLCTNAFVAALLCASLAPSPALAKETGSLFLDADAIDLVLIDPDIETRTTISPAFLLAWGKHHVVVKDEALFSQIAQAGHDLIKHDPIAPRVDARFGIIALRQGTIVFSMFSSAVYKGPNGDVITPEAYIDGERFSVSPDFVNSVTSLARQKYGQYLFKKQGE